MAGYSGTPLVKKLGIKPRHIVGLINAPSGFEDSLCDGVVCELPAGAMQSIRSALPNDVQIQSELKGRVPFDVIVYFTKRETDLIKQIPKLVKRLSLAGGLWIAWPKRTSGVVTDLKENRIREIGLATGLVDNKVCAIDETWSGLRFVIRIKDRPKK